MSTLYVDVDDTLILWNWAEVEERGGAGIVALTMGAHAYSINRKLVDALRRHIGEFDELVIWSMGGGQYAWDVWHSNEVQAMVGPLALPRPPKLGFMDKYNLIPGPGDVCIDDDPLPSFRSATIHPRDLL